MQTSQARTCPLLVGPREQALREDGLEGVGELIHDVVLLLVREDAEDALDGLDGVGRVQGREHEMAGLGGRQGGGDGLQVAHLADDHDVGVLPEDVRQRLAERRRVGVDLLLDDDAAVVLVDELDGVLDRHDLGAALAVDQVDDVVERGRLAVAGRAGDEDQAVGQARQLVDDRRQAELAPRADRQSRRGGWPSRGSRRGGRRWRGTARRPASAARSRAASRARRPRAASRSAARRAWRGASPRRGRRRRSGGSRR